MPAARRMIYVVIICMVLFMGALMVIWQFQEEGPVKEPPPAEAQP
jgi:hypothetical protein